MKIALLHSSVFLPRHIYNSVYILSHTLVLQAFKRLQVQYETDLWLIIQIHDYYQFN